MTPPASTAPRQLVDEVRQSLDPADAMTIYAAALLTGRPIEDVLHDAAEHVRTTHSRKQG